MRHTRPIVLLAVAAAAAACAPKATPVDTSADVAAIKTMQDHELAMVGSGNVDSAVTPYTSDVLIMPPGEAAIMGTAALRSWFENFTKDNTIAGSYSTNDVEVSGDLGVVHYIGTLTVTPKKGGPAMTETIKGIHVYKRQPDGSWKIAQDVWNTDAPPPDAAPSPPPPAKKK
jgi:ketosteroid isomerase-like protein